MSCDFTNTGMERATSVGSSLAGQRYDKSTAISSKFASTVPSATTRHSSSAKSMQPASSTNSIPVFVEAEVSVFELRTQALGHLFQRTY